MTEAELEVAIYQSPGVGNNGRATPLTWPPLEDWGLATPSPLATLQYAEHLLRPGRILLVAAVEGVGKSYAIDGELGIRLACAGGSFAGTWRIIQTGTVVTFSEMHRDDDLEYRDAVLGSLGLQASDLVGRYWHQNLMLAAGGEPALTSAEWQRRTLEQCRELGAIALIVDTATTATGGLEPWGPKMVALIHQLRAMLAAYPALAIILVVHLRKPTGRGRVAERQITDILGDWGKWADALLLMEDDGDNKTKLSTYKRVGQQRRIVARRQGGLLVDPLDLTGRKGAPKISDDNFLGWIEINADCTIADLMQQFTLAENTVKSYVKRLDRHLRVRQEGGRYGIKRFSRRPSAEMNQEDRPWICLGVWG